MMKEVPRISEAEWEVMKIVWSKSPLTAGEVIETLDNDTDWKPATVKSLITK